MQIFLILGVPLLLAAVSPLIRKNRINGLVSAAGHAVVLAVSGILALKISAVKSLFLLDKFIYADSLSAFFVLVVSLSVFAAALYSIGYIGRDVRENKITDKRAGTYYLLLNLFAFTMYCVILFNNLVMAWIAIEATTLVSAFLVGFYNNRGSVEASWKYIIICSVGISLALFGIILFYYAAGQAGGTRSVNWTDLRAIAAAFDPGIVKIAFLFIVVGYGTKAGLAPMHTWLPDAHSQAPAPVSALLSGVLLKTAFYAILRFAILANQSAGAAYTRHIFMLFGLVSLGVAAAFILVQKDIKRLLAYSSVEHIGVISIAMGFGGPIALFGGLLHVLNHAMTKSLMFFGAGTLAQNYKTADMSRMSGVLGLMPFIGIVLCVGVFALAGSPPFSIFMSEFMIAASAFKTGSYIPAALFLLFLAVIFGAIAHQFGKVLFGRKPAEITAVETPATAKAAIVFLLLFICLLGLHIPKLVEGLLNASVAILQGGPNG